MWCICIFGSSTFFYKWLVDFPSPKINFCLPKICKECFYEVFEEEIHQVIVDNQLFKPGERIAIGASGGKGDCSLTVV